jgi:HSP20 family protein
MKHGTITKPDATRWLPEFPEMRRLFEGLPTICNGFDAMKLEEQMDGATYVVRAELPGIDPEKDADVWVADGMLHMKAERRLDEQTEKDGTFRSEFSYGAFHRAVALPKGAVTDDVTATYKDGVLEVRLPVRPVATPTAKVPISRT